MKTESARAHIRGLLEQALAAAQAQNKLPPLASTDVTVEYAPPEKADYASNLALRLSRAVRMPPMQVAEVIVAALPESPYLAEVTAAPPGFINFHLDETWLARQVGEVIAQGAAYGNCDVGGSTALQVEFCSANPTGPLTIGSGRNIVLGDTLARVLEAANYAVQREYYVNDVGGQMDIFARTLLARYQQLHGIDAHVPPDGYAGEYMVELAGQIKQESGDALLHVPEDEALQKLHERGLALMLDSIREDCALLGAQFDEWVAQSWLEDEGRVQAAIDTLRERGRVAEREGATWLVSSDLEEDKDNVLVRSNGEPTYFAADIAYHDYKLERGYTSLIDVWGADHHGHVPRVKASLAALGHDPEQLTILLYQLVRVLRGGEEVRMSKRTGDVVTVREVVDEVGVDASRYFLVARSPDTAMSFDLDLAQEQSDENPVYYIQYAHARTASILERAVREGMAPGDADLALLQHPAELTLLRLMIRLPELVEDVALQHTPHRLAFYAQELAALFHAFYRDCRVIDPENAALSQARLQLVQAAKLVFARCLGLMGMSAPDRM
ncbi:MAG: arginine--tRNA ligase [Chloroflexota bacterium]|nr:arginine--tRNA ligase [Chloroflexota bacterium]MDE2840301.1 arginine--tRNA ligase [Chloroflexota bacterium]MDE2930014.1 arginine--tRNA ligase [Chloroflexota bacterium]